MVQRCRNNHPGQRCTFQAIYGQNPHADTIFQIQEHKLRLWATKTKRKVIGGHKTQLCRAPCHIARTMARLKRQPASKIPNEVSNTRTTLHRAAQDTLSSNNEATPALLLVRCLSMEPNNRSRLYTTHVLTLLLYATLPTTWTHWMSKLLPSSMIMQRATPHQPGDDTKKLISHKTRVGLSTVDNTVMLHRPSAHSYLSFNPTSLWSAKSMQKHRLGNKQL